VTFYDLRVKLSPATLMTNHTGVLSKKKTKSTCQLDTNTIPFNAER